MLSKQLIPNYHLKLHKLFCVEVYFSVLRMITFLHPGVLLDCLERPEEEIILGDLRLTLDLICLTLPPDFDVCAPFDEETSEHSDRRRGTSFTEPSPPDSPPAEIIRPNLRSGFKLSVSEFDE